MAHTDIVLVNRVQTDNRVHILRERYYFGRIIWGTNTSRYIPLTSYLIVYIYKYFPSATKQMVIDSYIHNKCC